MIYQSLDVAEAVQEGRKLSYMLVRGLSKVSIGKIESEEDLNLDEVNEIRFFNQEQEIRVVREGNQLRGVLVTPEEEEHFIDHRWELRQERFGQELSVRYVLKTDEDGQTYVAGDRILDWKGGVANV